MRLQFFDIIIIICGLARSQTPTEPVITENGLVIGITKLASNQIVYQFLGIPYAKPPLNNLRFKKPVTADSWTNNYQANAFKSSCMQPDVSSSEDCLYLNIFTPTLNKSANLSVMLFIHGGGFKTDSGSIDSSLLAIRNVVVVTLNYRLGVFGFLFGNSTEEPGNVGLWDQVMALNWTARNIDNFGGNPSDITLIGQSAGSISISDLIVSNPSIGAINLFKKAILLSGTAYNIVLTQSTTYAYSLAIRYATNAFFWPWDKCVNDNNWINCLRSKNANQLISAQTNTNAYNQNSFNPDLQFTPIFGDELIPISPNVAVKQGYFRRDLNLLISHVEMEAQVFAFGLDVSKQLLGRYTAFIERPLIISKSIVHNDIRDIFLANIPYGQSVANAYTDSFNDSSILLNPQPIRRSAVFAYSDFFLSCPTILFGASIAKWQSFSGKVFQSRFTYSSLITPNRYSVWANVSHGEDILYLFGTPITIPLLFTNDERVLSNTIMDSYTHFAKTGEMPTINPIFGVWPSYAVNNGTVNASYVELHADINRLGRVFANRYRGSDGYDPSVIYDCFNFWDPLFNSQFN